MITAIEIENLRGIRTGRLDGLGPLTILTGPNACGKSTVLDALLIVASPFPPAAVVKAVERHPAVAAGAGWLFRFGSPRAELRAEVAGNGGVTRVRSLKWHDLFRGEMLWEELSRRGSPTPYSTIEISLAEGDSRQISAVTFGGDNQFIVAGEPLADGMGPDSVTVVDAGLPNPMHHVFSRVAQTGQRSRVEGLLEELIPGFERLEIIQLAEETFGLAVTSNGRSVPVGLSGDGIQALVQLSLGIALEPGGLALVEEPEVYQHPKAIWQSARALLATVRRGVQVVLTTHSLELIDALLAEASEEDIGRMALFNLALEDGELRSGLRAGEEIRFARATLENDLR